MEGESMQHSYVFDVVAVGICLWFIKSYILGICHTKEEKFIHDEAPRWLLWLVTVIVCISLLILVSADVGLLPIPVDSVYRVAVAGFLMWLAMALYTKWNWGISLADKEIKKRNNRQMIMILFLMFFLATTLK